MEKEGPGNLLLKKNEIGRRMYKKLIQLEGQLTKLEIEVREVWKKIVCSKNLYCFSLRFRQEGEAPLPFRPVFLAPVKKNPFLGRRASFKIYSRAEMRGHNTLCSHWACCSSSFTPRKERDKPPHFHRISL